MRKFLVSVGIAACALSGATVANAQTATQDIAITATVLKACTVNNVATGSPVGSATIPITAAGAVTTTAITPTGSPFANVACNAASNLQLTSLNGGVLNAGAAGSGFSNVINYSATATWNGATAAIDTSTVGTASVGANETGAVVGIPTANAGNLSVSIVPAANPLPLITGTYNDTLRVTLTPQ